VFRGRLTVVGFSHPALQFSACDDALGADWPGGGGPSSSADCWGTPHYRRTALLLVDALRFDFVAPAQDAACDSSALGCTSKMPRLLALHQQSVRNVAQFVLVITLMNYPSLVT
jgi:hypothetical protein